MKSMWIVWMTIFVAVVEIGQGAAEAEVKIIVHPNLAVSSVSQREIREIFMGKRVKWGDNTTIKAVTLEEPSVHDQFLEQYVKRTPSQWKQYWKKMIFTGRALPPKAVESATEVIRFVSDTPGAIGYIDAETPHDSVKVLSIQ